MTCQAETGQNAVRVSCVMLRVFSWSFSKFKKLLVDPVLVLKRLVTLTVHPTLALALSHANRLQNVANVLRMRHASSWACFAS